ncbi:MAG: hypothetical protein IPG64_20995 [Haliea sp.]|nr:hypothetical protein [Haliea sp.]
MRNSARRTAPGGGAGTLAFAGGSNRHRPSLRANHARAAELALQRRITLPRLAVAPEQVAVDQ